MTNAQHNDTLLETLRRNVSILGELALRYGVETHPPRPADPPTVYSPEAVRLLLAPEMAHLAQEQFRVLLLDTKTRIVGQRVIYQGDVSSITVRPAEVFRPAVMEAVPKIIVIHNHPSNDPEPSPADVALTKKLIEAGKLLGIELLDHLVIGGDKAVSLKERGLITAL